MTTSTARRIRLLAGVLLGLALGPLTPPAAAQAQTFDRPTIRVAGFGGASLRQGLTGLAIAEHALTVSGRLTWLRRGFRPWVQGEYFTRPGLECPGGIVCNEDGWTALVGVAAPLSARSDFQPGVHPYLLGGVGWAFSVENQFSYLFGVGAAFAFTRRIAPSLEIRWEDFPALTNVVMLTLGLRIDLF